MRKFVYFSNCVNLNGQRITDMVDRSREITYRTFMDHVDQEAVKELFPFYIWRDRSDSCKNGLYLKNDFAVSYHKSKYHGKPCYYLCHSCIEYVFV